MKSYRLSILASLTLAALLSACGGDNVQIATPELAATAQSSPADAQAPDAAPAYTASQVASAGMPQPDCAADGCKGLRIIDGNAEGFRYQAMQQAMQQGDAPQS